MMIGNLARSKRRHAVPLALFAFPFLLLCAGCTLPPTTHASGRSGYLHISPAILVLAQQAEVRRLERRNASILSSPLARVDRTGRLDLVIGYRGPKQPILTALHEIGARVVAQPDEDHQIEAWIPARRVASLARISGIISVHFAKTAHARI